MECCMYKTYSRRERKVIQDYTWWAIFLACISQIFEAATGQIGKKPIMCDNLQYTIEKSPHTSRALGKYMAMLQPDPASIPE
ncbi:hypothetical protein METBIDRAFT_110480 [Metschnikowia bicuspidata var. bicuspidata NRRL YB-4993]|uniref:Uncharacterized protein n=1 Tax=Metschnikowia bicuspidata var. bicuspidata NRRL YB-4993 TaxID=869754 RepID=A0A1A0HIG4_9ASCO|nr:hypothetical protein METBIDRAFT_110480 [Metschnikowia bicuspidata var. bicuspidata NRRL YB-4993]OBA23672.1 hypothetical protein METBIDRAFT_110480 [Metschnikowia bicuspidata var. bicuspidata NRRL YB-4993]